MKAETRDKAPTIYEIERRGDDNVCVHHSKGKDVMALATFAAKLERGELRLPTVLRAE
jgi:hypothetical protein